MSGPEPSLSFIWQIVSGVTVAACIGLGRAITGKASKEELADAVSSAKEQDAAMLERFDRLEDKFDDLNRTLGATMVSLSRLQGQLDREDDERRRQR